MPLPSACTPFGMLAYSGKPSHAQQILDAMTRAQGGNYAPDGPQAARLYATAMGLASQQYTLERAQNQDDPTKIGELLPDREREYQLTPSPGDSDTERRSALAAKMLAAGGGSAANVAQALRTLLGSDFVAYHPIKGSDGGASPTTIAASPGTFKDPSVQTKIYALNQCISHGLGAPQWTGVTYVAGSTEPLAPGEVITVDPGRLGCMESVTISAVQGLVIQATFNLPHDVSALATTGSHPLWTSTYQTHLVVLTNDAARDGETRRKVADLMNLVLRGTATWAITLEYALGSVGPFTICWNAGLGLGGEINITPIAQINL